MNQISGNGLESKFAANEALINHEQVMLTWYGGAHYHIDYNGIKIIIDPLFTRPPGDTPHLTVKKDDIDKIDYLLLTHAHVDHSWDFPYLASKYLPEAYAPTRYLNYMRRKENKWGLKFDPSKFYSLETEKNRAFKIADIEVIPYQIGTEEIDLWFVKNGIIATVQNWAYKEAVKALFKFFLFQLKGNCFSYFFKFPPSGKTLLYFSNLTDQVDDLHEIKNVNVLIIPYCPANKKWIQQSQYLINRFSPEVALVHHYDDFWHPFTSVYYMSLNGYKKVILSKFPDLNLKFSRFLEKRSFDEISSA
jgi:hypothetical protein